MKKISLKDNVNKLSRSEMKNIAGGDFGIIGGGGSGGTTCNKNTCTSTCVVNWNGTCSCTSWNGQPIVGTCTATYIP